MGDRYNVYPPEAWIYVFNRNNRLAQQIFDRLGASGTLEAAPVLEAVNRAIETHGVPAIINNDQGSQFTSDEYIALLKKRGIRQSMDGKARWIDNVIIERWFRSLKQEHIHITEYTSPRTLRHGIKKYVDEYNVDRPHQSLGYQSPHCVCRRGWTPRVGEVRHLRRRNCTSLVGQIVQ